ncbi:hypothetical protein BKA63DRAFT_421478, partial [Paraphoma chrysanthemicola]
MAAGKSKKPLKGAAISRLLSFWWQEIVDRSKRVNSNKEKLKDISRVCFHHLRFIAAKVGLQHRALNQENMSNVLEVLKTHPNKWVEYQNDPQYRVLFRAGFRAEYENQDMLSYRFRPAMLEAPDLDYDSIIKEMGWTGIVKEFRRTGTLITDCFSWMFKDPDLVKIIDGSFDAFRWHQRRIGGKENLGWNRAMFHSIPQQLVRGDIEYWLLYACLRREYWLISYPYYTKYAMVGDRTEFKHIDLNIDQAVKYGYGVDMIQGSVSLNDENDQNCTIMMDGFHNIAKEYMELRKEQGMETKAGHIEGWSNKDWPDEAKKKWPNVKFNDKPCKQGEIRISHPLLPHGTKGPAKTVRRTILPWFVLIQGDHETMENPAMGTYRQIAEAHQTLTAAPCTPSGYPNKYGGITWPMPGMTIHRFSSAISRAIHCQERWDSPTVIEEIE